MAKKVIIPILCITLLCGCGNISWGRDGYKDKKVDISDSSVVYTDEKRDEYLTECYQLLNAPIYEDTGSSFRYEAHILDENGYTTETIPLDEYNGRVNEFLSTWEKTDMYYIAPYSGTEKERYDVYYNREYDLIADRGDTDFKGYYNARLCNDTGRIAKGHEAFIEDMRSSTGLMYNDCSAGGKYTRLDFSNIEYGFLRDFPYHYNGIEVHISHLPVRVSLYFEGEKPVKAYISYMKVKNLDNKMDEETKTALVKALEKAGFEDCALIVNEAAKAVESNNISPSAGKYKLLHLDTSEPIGYWKEDFLTGKGVIAVQPY